MIFNFMNAFVHTEPGVNDESFNPISPTECILPLPSVPVKRVIRLIRIRSNETANEPNAIASSVGGNASSVGRNHVADAMRALHRPLVMNVDLEGK